MCHAYAKFVCATEWHWWQGYRKVILPADVVLVTLIVFNGGVIIGYVFVVTPLSHLDTVEISSREVVVLAILYLSVVVGDEFG